MNIPRLERVDKEGRDWETRRVEIERKIIEVLEKVGKGREEKNKKIG